MSEKIESLYPEMVERAARALCRSKAQGVPDSWMENHVNTNWLPFAHDAKTVIEAMREPTDGMIAAAMAINHPSCYSADPDDEWRAMIDEALK